MHGSTGERQSGAKAWLDEDKPVENLNGWLLGVKAQVCLGTEVAPDRVKGLLKVKTLDIEVLE